MTQTPAARNSWSRRSIGCLLLALVSLAGVNSGCNIVGPAYILITGPPKTPAQVELEKSRMYVVLIDDMRSRLPKQALRSRISQAAEAKMIRENVLRADHLIPSGAAYTVMREESLLDRMTIVDIGRRIGAEVVIYVIIDNWELTRDRVSAWPRVDARIKLLDVESNQRLWPGGDSGFPLTIEPMELRTGDLPTSLGGRSDLEEALAERFGQSIAQLFYKHITREAAKD